MTHSLWTEVDMYLESKLLTRDEVLETALAANAEAGLPAIDVTPTGGKLLELYARMIDAHRILEIGTLGGYSTICLGRALAAGDQLLSLEINPRHARVASANIERAGLAADIEIIVGRAADTLDRLIEQAVEPFDLVFIDADKESCAEYLERSLQLTRPGSVIICDNVVRSGEVSNPDSTDSMVVGVRRFFDAVAAEPRLDGTAIQTVGRKGYDGFAIAIVGARGR